VVDEGSCVCVECRKQSVADGGGDRDGGESYWAARRSCYEEARARQITRGPCARALSRSLLMFRQAPAYSAICLSAAHRACRID
jgi:hypothetical protein